MLNHIYEKEQRIFKKALNRLFKSIFFLFLFICTIDSISQNISKSQRLFGLSKLWSEITYNYPNLDRLNFSVDSLYIEFIDKVIDSNSDEDYYHVLNLFISNLHEGHSFINYPKGFCKNYYCQILSYYSNNQVYVVGISDELKDSLPIGSKILEINNIPVLKYIDSVLFPKSQVRSEIRYNYLSEFLLYTPSLDSVFNITFENKDKQIKKVKIKAVKDFNKFNEVYFQYPLKSELKLLEDSILYISINNFKTPDIFSEFIDSIELVKKSNGLIFDLRHSEGGTSYGSSLYSYFTKDSVFNEYLYSKRINDSYLKAKGAYADSLVMIFLNRNKSHKRYTYYKDYYDWFDNRVLQKDSVQIILEKSDFKYDKPIIILIDEKTASAAEMFLIGMKDLTSAKVVGTPSYGSASQPLFIPLPLGGMGQICTQKIYYSDGTEFKYCKPDFLIEPSISDILNKKDIALLKAINIIKGIK